MFNLSDLMKALSDAAETIGASRPLRRVKAPDFVGELTSACFLIAVRAGVEIDIVRLTENPAPAEGIVVRQHPPPGTRVRRGSTVTLEVLHPSA
ncbi:MAG: PASTA domain-containing protein [Acidimicrobiales bacterium]